MPRNRKLTDTEKTLLMHERYPALMLSVEAFNACVESMPLAKQYKDRLRAAHLACMNEYGLSVQDILERVEVKK